MVTENEADKEIEIPPYASGKADGTADNLQNMRYRCGDLSYNDGSVHEHF
jgi:hypothetical protein